MLVFIRLWISIEPNGILNMVIQSYKAIKSVMLVSQVRASIKQLIGILNLYKPYTAKRRHEWESEIAQSP